MKGSEGNELTPVGELSEEELGQAVGGCFNTSCGFLTGS
jgi:hypothetical protein